MSTLNLLTPSPAREDGPSSDPQRIYFAAPKATYETTRYRTRYAQARAHFPDAEFIEARCAYVDMADWQDNWPMVLATLDAFVFIADDQGWIGRGVWTEIMEASEEHPVHFLTDAGALVPREALRFSTPRLGNWTQHVRVRVRATRRT